MCGNVKIGRGVETANKIPAQIGVIMINDRGFHIIHVETEGVAEQEYEQQGRAGLFKALRGSLAGTGGTAPYAELAERLGMTEGAVKVAVHRLRGRFRERLREEIAQTVAGQEDVDDEIRSLFDALRH